MEAALKTALLATGKPGVIAFDKGYHGLGYGALNATHPLFRAPFLSQLGNFGCFSRSDRRRSLKVECAISRLLRKQEIGAILVEPIQGRGGINAPPPAFLPTLRRLSSDRGAPLLVDEVYTGLGRTGRWFACEHRETIPDLICLGKALTGGFPLSACVGRADLMDAAWPSSCGEAIHTSTFLGHPVGCAMALAQIAEIRDRRLVQRSSKLGKFFFMKLLGLQIPRAETRGLGLMIGGASFPGRLSGHKIGLAGSEGNAATRLYPVARGKNGNVWVYTTLTIDQRQLQQASDERRKF